MEKYGAEARDFAEIARVSHAHSANNPYAQFRDVHTLEQISISPTIHAPSSNAVRQVTVLERLSSFHKNSSMLDRV
jgi:acetyl-CoA acetyltransferase